MGIILKALGSARTPCIPPCQFFVSVWMLGTRGLLIDVDQCTHCAPVSLTELHEGDVQVSVEELWEGLEHSRRDPKAHSNRSPGVRHLRYNEKAQTCLLSTPYLPCALTLIHTVNERGVSYSTIQMFGSVGFFFLQRCIKLIKSTSRDIYNIK